jgi:hypothetical protein
VACKESKEVTSRTVVGYCWGCWFLGGVQPISRTERYTFAAPTSQRRARGRTVDHPDEAAVGVKSCCARQS